MSSHESGYVRNRWSILAFVIAASIIISVSLSVISIYTLYTVVSPPILEPVIQGISVCLEILGLQMIIQRNICNSRTYTELCVIIAIVAMIAAAKFMKISFVGIWGYALVCFCMVILLSFASPAIGRIQSNRIRIVLGVIMAICGIVVPIWLTGVFSYDLGFD